MKVKFWCDNGANRASVKHEIIDIMDEYGITDEMWGEMGEDEKEELAEEWALQHLGFGTEEVEE